MQAADYRHPLEIDALVAKVQTQVQRNCDISDFNHAADVTICIYLMRMREYFRWEKGLGWTDSLPQKALMRWIAEKEQRWEALADADYAPIEIEGVHYDSYDQAGINAHLLSRGFVYQAGTGRGGKPVFVLAELAAQEEIEQYTLTRLGRELARELASPVAATQETTTGKQAIHLRTHALQRLIWDLVEEWRWHKPDNAMSEVIKHYDFDARPLESLQQATEEQAEMLVLHEIGEVVAGDLLGQGWNPWLSDHTGEASELFARAARDYLADCLVTLPGLLATDNDTALHFYFANLTPLRKSMFPSLVAAYRVWRKTGALQGLKQCARDGQRYWRCVGENLLEKSAPLPSMEQLVAQHAL